MESHFIELSNIRKVYKDKEVLNLNQLGVRKGEIISIVGPSGTGKSTLLRLVAGLEKADTGEIMIDGEHLTNVPPQQRPVVYMFQESLLFPHMNVLENVAFGLKMAKVSKNKRYDKSKEMMKRVGLEGLESRFPHEISGGQKQRAALARSLIVHPKVLLLDEPFSSLDTELRKETRRWIKHLLKSENITVLFVTHDLEEAMALGDRVAVLNEGKLQQLDSPHVLYESPVNSFVASFLQGGIWTEERFIPVSRLKMGRNDDQNGRKAEVIETYYQDGKYHSVLSIEHSEAVITLTNREKVNVGEQVKVFEG
ncbi:ABC transporter ATP-binding protein [Fictibacillus norfolkensis]|uniref:ABC transporter ATP-binding protein n=1 Tax=Fictibacillus norfolkensis TaxID=2762233 RepID=A0ABR8SJ82_9BACL|nr:ABC transporter ATP-binding protein [Fictibacillus norfolkensis]MBD7963530.1 ABC transporter ATP-binding protein [Fictibacillus norfolkensis]